MPRLTLLLAIASFLLAGPAAAQQPVTIRIVQTNDIDRMGEDKGRGGFARLASVVKAERAKGNALFVHAGDTLSPSLLSGFDRGAHIVDLLNRLGIDVFTPGNHEFDFGPDNFRARMAEARFDVVASNVSERDGAQPANTRPDKMVEVEGVRIGFLGLITETTPTVSSPGDIRFLPPIETARVKARELRERGADLVVAVAHTSLGVDLELARLGAVDLVVSGHDEHLLAFYDGRAAVTESQSQANWVVVTEITVTKEVRDGKAAVSWRPSFRMVDSATVTPDPEIAAVVKGHEDRLGVELDVGVGLLEAPLDSRRATVRSREAAIGNLIADAMRAAVGGEIGLTNGGGIRGDRQYEAGRQLTRRDVLSELPFGNTTVLVEVTGAQLKAVLEHGFGAAPEGGGRFPQVSGLRVEVDLKAPAGSRVTQVLVAGTPLDPARTYGLATNDFIARGGDGYAMLAEARRIVDESASQIMATQVIDHVARLGRVAPLVEGRIVLR